MRTTSNEGAIMPDQHEVNSVDSFDDDLSQSFAEEIGLISQEHRLSNRAPRLVQNTRKRARQLLDPDILRSITAIAFLVVLWHSFSLSISLVSDDDDSVEATFTDRGSTTNGCSQGIPLSSRFLSS
jgi:hypothetical protein